MISTMLISANDLRKKLSYDPLTGKMVWLVNSPRTKHGDVAGSKWNDGYSRVTIGKRDYYTHRLAWLHFYGRWPKLQIDHINGDRSDNRISNLRETDYFGNARNARLRNNTKCRLKGVDISRGKYRARIKLNGKDKHLGMFLRAEDAHAAYAAAAKELHGEFARLK